MKNWHMHGGDDAGPCCDPRCERPEPPRIPRPPNLIGTDDTPRMGAVDWVAVVLFLGAVLAAIGALR